MPFYEYRKLSPEEQAALVQERRARGFPAHRPPHLDQGPRYYLLSAATYEHAPLIEPAARRDTFQRALISAFEQQDIEITAWVLLPNHYHILVWLPTITLAAPIFNQLHGRTSSEWNREEGQRGRKVWYRYSDRAIRDEPHFYRAINYIHANPVNHGYMRLSRDWPWSSLQRYLEEVGIEWLDSIWKRYAVGTFGRGWDDSVMPPSGGGTRP
jgi:putative transposase